MMSLKQKLAISLCAFYVISIMGVALSLHFCGGKLADVSVINAKVACKYCKAEPLAEKQDNCCKNTKVDLKVKDSHQIESAAKLPKFFSVDMIFHETFRYVLRNFVPTIFSKIAHKAPPKTGVALHVMNCVFRN
ncbi:HYC_CC_PP family protein [Pedobacter insulae]|uniref:Uncharacterized protein n=1 Tax=Pedobacter insulae TaxID=414048 RepID=A0A1I2XCP2_9SPHI|nr:hypothetical protein [Pedobacter insulae]SFH11268.1 hypothetical protein SAMN04489864_105151 [Pedobacter insulae]